MSNAPLAFTVTIAVLLLVAAGMSAVTAVRGWKETLRRDGRLGIHSLAAGASDQAFSVANKVAAPVVGGAAVVAVLFTVLVIVLPVPTLATVVVAVLGLVAVAVMLIAAGVLGERAARTLPIPARRPNASGACGGCACGGGGCAGITRTAVSVDAGAPTGTEST